MRTFAGIARLAACWAAPLLWAHGLIEEPPSRSWVCGVDTKPDEIKWGTAKTPACSTAFAVNPVAAYDYMAVLSHTLGRSEVEPLPAYVCGFASEKWNGTETPWDAPMDWPVNPVSPGPINIKWNIVWGPHFDDTKEFKYWITKSDFVFSPAKALSWDDFEAEPFCSLPYDDTHPTANPDVTADKAASTFVTRCTLPQRSGHHVVYGEWGRTPPTYERFHSCFDAQFGSTGIRIPFRPGFPAGRPVPEKTESGVDALGRLRPAERPGILSRPSRPADMR
jgi:chitin-binding protein